MNLHSAFRFDHYLLRRQVLALTGKFRLFDPNGQLVLYSQQKMFRLKEDIRAYSDESCSQELLHIQARQIIDFSAAYDVVDSLSRERVGVLRRRGWRSLLRDEWEVLDADEQPVGLMQEDDMTRAILRRFLLGRWLPQDYDVLIGGQRVADLRQRFNLFRYELDLDFRMDPGQRLDHRLGIAAAILLGTIEGRQE
ncbi:MAG TPA: hypothetical protein VGA03_08975 [Anaerolineales bacterium]